LTPGTTRRWLGRAALAGWLVLGAFAIRLAPDPPAPAPEVARLAYGEQPSMRSSAPHGALALAKTLERLGLEVVANRRLGAPDADALLLLEPTGALSDAEAQALADWVSDGGRLVYAPAGGHPRDALLDALSPDQPIGDESGTRRVRRRGDGRWLVLPDGADRLTNERLREDGLDDLWPALRDVLDGARRVAFDELRLDLASPEDARDQLLRSRFGAGALALLVALGVFLIGRGPRREPAMAEPPGPGRRFGEHLDAVGRVLRAGGRHRLAATRLVDGTRRRLGPLADAEGVREELAQADADAASRLDGARLVALAVRLQRLEAERLGDGAATARSAAVAPEGPNIRPREVA